VYGKWQHKIDETAVTDGIFYRLNLWPDYHHDEQGLYYMQLYVLFVGAGFCWRPRVV